MDANQTLPPEPTSLLASIPVELTEDETIEALIRKKLEKLQTQEEKARLAQVEANRQRLTSSQWDAEQTKQFVFWRAAQMFAGKKNPDGSPKVLVFDKYNSLVFDLLCLYFSNDVRFVSFATNMGIKKPSLDKGIALLGQFGTGKSLFMSLFAKNQRQVYRVCSVKDVADEFADKGEDSKYVNKMPNPLNDAGAFYQPYTGLCLDDLGTDDEKVHYGNRKNVVGDLIEKRYNKENTGVFLHCTSNLGPDEIKEFYGGRVLSRMYEIFNFIVLPGEDRRK